MTFEVMPQSIGPLRPDARLWALFTTALCLALLAAVVIPAGVQSSQTQREGAEIKGAEKAAAPTAAALPSADSLLSRLPSQPAVTTRVVTGTVERYNGRDDPKSGPFTLTITGDKIDYKTDLSHPPEAKRALFPFVLVANPKATRVIAVDQIEMANGEIWTIDEKRGVVTRRHRELTTPLGILPEEIEYDDWREIGGAKLPFVTRWLRADYRVTFTVHEVSNGSSR